jgi:diguanylate cyclase (GGDEF)-like protein/PAS domain S-box-containing protein
MLNGANISTSDYTYIKHTYNKDDLINNSVDVISGYITDQPFYYKEQGLDVNVINPQNYGYDFYGDILFTSLDEVENNPGRVEKFKTATLKGWEYALEHPEEIIQLIKTKYQSTLSVDHLRYEAQETKKLILPDLIPIGDIQLDRMRRVVETYSQLSESKKVTEQKLKKFFYSEYQKKFTLTNEEKAWLEQHPVIRVGIDNDFEPYEWVDKSGQYLGLTADYLSIVESKLGVEFDILKELNWSEMLDHAASGKLHMIAGAVNTPKRRQFLEFTPPFISNSVVLISNEQQGFIGELSRLNNKKLAIENGYFLAELIKRDYPDIKVVKVDNIDEAFALVDSGQADAYAGDALATSYALKELGYSTLRIAGVTDYTSATSMAVIKTEPILLSIINKALASITIDEEQSIRDFWMSSTPKSVISMKQILKISIALSLVFLILGYWLFRLKKEVRARKSVETELNTILDTAPECVKVMDSNGNIRRINQPGLSMLNPLDEPFGVESQNIWKYIFPEHKADFDRHLTRVLNGEKAVLDYKIKCVNNDEKWVSSYSAPYKDGLSEETLILSVTRDITHRRLVEEQLQLSHEVFMSTHEGIMLTDSNSSITDVNPAFTDITGYSKNDVLGKKPSVLASGKQSPDFYKTMWEQLDSNGKWQGEIWNRHKDGSFYAELLSISAIKDHSGVVKSYVGVFSDITQSMQQQEQLNLLAHYDVLTKLPNRTLFTDRFSQAIAHSKRANVSLAICFLDIDDFKPINDTYGHDVGDELLIQISKRIQSVLREGDTVSRQGGDEFALLLTEIDSREECEQLVQRLLEVISAPYSIGHTLHTITASVGITVYPKDLGDIDTLLRHADQAMYQAKLQGKNNYLFFDEQMDKDVSLKTARLTEIKDALIDRQFQLYYQPKVNMHTGKVFGVEALIRWIHPEKGLIPPLDFLPAIDGTDLECEVGNWVIETALQQISNWRGKGIDVEVSVNIASHHLQQKDFTESLAKILSNHEHVPASRLQLEVLESSVLSDIDSVKNTIKICQENLGVRFALDDFGTGYSSLAHLRSLSANSIKIDQTFVRDLLDDYNDYVIVSGVIGLAKSFNREVIAEGVESECHGLMLLSMGCNLAQGYGIAKPMPASDFEIWLDNYSPKTKWLNLSLKLSARHKYCTRLNLIINQWKTRFIKRISTEYPASNNLPVMDMNKTFVWVWISQAKLSEVMPVSDVEVIQTAFMHVFEHAEELMLVYDTTKTVIPEKQRAAFLEQTDNLEKLVELYSTATSYIP